MSLSFPTLPDGLDLPMWYFVFLYVENQLGAGNKDIKDLGWGPRTRHLVFVPLFLWGGNHAASRRTIGVFCQGV